MGKGGRKEQVSKGVWCKTKFSVKKVEDEPEQACKSARGFIVVLVIERNSHHKKKKGTEYKKRICRLESNKTAKWKKGELKIYLISSSLCWCLIGVKEVFVISNIRHCWRGGVWMDNQVSKMSITAPISTNTMKQTSSAIHPFCEAEAGLPRLKSENGNEIGWIWSSSTCWKENVK